MLPMNILGHKEDETNKEFFPSIREEFPAHSILIVI